MQINQNNQPSFGGRFSSKTLAKFKENLSPKEYKMVKNFRAGKKYTQFDIVTISSEPVRLMNGTQISTSLRMRNFKFKVQKRCKRAHQIGEWCFAV